MKPTKTKNKTEAKYTVKVRDIFEGTLQYDDVNGNTSLYNLVNSYKVINDDGTDGERYPGSPNPYVYGGKEFYYLVSDQGPYGSQGALCYVGPLDLGGFRVKDVFQRVSKLDQSVREKAKDFGLREVYLFAQLAGYSTNHGFDQDISSRIYARVKDWNKEIERLEKRIREVAFRRE